MTKHNLSGQTFGLWLVLRQSTHDQSYWVCQCQGCSRESPVLVHNLLSGKSRGCVYCRAKSVAQRKKRDFSGLTFGRWLVLRPTEQLRVWWCRCLGCGTEHQVNRKEFRYGGTYGCQQCYFAWKRSDEGRQQLETHGKSSSIEYYSYRSMKSRCYNVNDPNYVRYGGRGITVCDRWKSSFDEFFKDIGPRPNLKYSLERINNDGNYEPGNCKWANSKEQSNNKINTIRLIIDDCEITLMDACKKYNINPRTVRARLRMGWDPKRALTVPPNPRLVKNVVFKGEVLSLDVAAQRCGLPYPEVLQRIRRGWEPLVALTTPLREAHQIKVEDGRVMNLMEAAAYYGTPIDTVRTRLKRGWDLMDALKTPALRKVGQSHTE